MLRRAAKLGDNFRRFLPRFGIEFEPVLRSASNRSRIGRFAIHEKRTKMSRSSRNGQPLGSVERCASRSAKKARLFGGFCHKSFTFDEALFMLV